MSSGKGNDSGRKRRRDFEHNRDAILATANEAFTELGLGVSIAAIAKRAGVAPATVYRHFPSKDAIVGAVFDLRIVAYAEAIESAQEIADPHEAFRQTIHAIVRLQARDRSFREILGSRNTHPSEHPGFARFGTALLGALQNARAASVVRDDVSDEDIMLLLIATEGIARPTGNHSRTALSRFVDLALGGICHTRAGLEGSPLAFDQLLDVARN